MAPFLADPTVGVLVETDVAAVFASLRFFEFFGALIGVLVVAAALALLGGFFDFAVRLLPDPTAGVLLGGLFEYFTTLLLGLIEFFAALLYRFLVVAVALPVAVAGALAFLGLNDFAILYSLLPDATVGVLDLLVVLAALAFLGSIEFFSSIELFLAIFSPISQLCSQEKEPRNRLALQ